eukprot:393625_1
MDDFSFLNGRRKYLKKILKHTSENIAEFKCEEYISINERIQCINTVLTEKCKLLSLKTLEENFSFDFEFPQKHQYLSRIDEFGKKHTRHLLSLREWWVNQQPSELSTTFLPKILDQIDEVSYAISKQTISDLRWQVKKYIQFELLETALKARFSRLREDYTGLCDVFPNASFQYSRGRLRKKLENAYFSQSETQNLTRYDKKKKHVWLKLIAQKKRTNKHKYYKRLIYCGLVIGFVRITFESKYKIYIPHELKQLMSVYIALPSDGSVHTIKGTTSVSFTNGHVRKMPDIQRKSHMNCSMCKLNMIKLIALKKEIQSFQLSLDESRRELIFKKKKKIVI